jgi:hypothetical protein
MGVPVGDFREKTFAPTEDGGAQQVEGYDIGLGGQFTVALPLSKNVAFRIGFSGMGTEGTNTMKDYETLILSHTMFSLSGELQVFFDNAYWLRGPYLVAGLSADFERFEQSYEDYYGGEPVPIDIRRKNRLGCTVGIGQIFGDGGMKLVLEVAYHATVTARDPARLDPTPSDFLRVGFGLVF